MRAWSGRGVGVLGLGVLVAGLAAGGVNASADAQSVRCGDVITQSTSLQADLVCGTAPALTIAGEDVTLDLGGRTIRYVGDVADGDPFVHVGVLIEGVDRTTAGVTVRNGRIEGYAGSVFPHLVSDISLERLRVDGTINLFETRGVVIERSELRDVDGGAAHDLTVRDSTLAGSVRLTESNTSRILDNRVRDGGVALHGWDSLVARNQFHDAPAAAISFGNFSGGSQATDNHILHAHVGIAFFDFAHDDILVRGNRITNSRSAAILAVDTVEPAPHNVRIEANEITRSGFQAPAGQPADGIRIAEPTVTGTTLTGNRVRVSAGHAIHAPGATDGGSNMARNPGAVPACVGVVCR